MLKILPLMLFLSSCVTVVRNQCAEDTFLDDEVLFRRGERVSLLFEEKYSFYKGSCLSRGKIIDIVGWEKGVVYYNVETACRDIDGTNYVRRSFKIPQNLLKKV
jgi:hypothetical protein